MENINNNEYKLSPKQYVIVNNIKDLVGDNFKLEDNNIILNDIHNYRLILDNIENVLDNLGNGYKLTEINFLGSNYIVIDLGGEYIKIICDVSFIDTIKDKINNLIKK